MMGATVAIPFLLCPALCIEDNDPARGYIISTIFFTSGIVTLLQTTFGCRYAKETRKLSLFNSSLLVLVKSMAQDVKKSYQK
jgi:xanthine/uracil permease